MCTFLILLELWILLCILVKDSTLWYKIKESHLVSNWSSSANHCVFPKQITYSKHTVRATLNRNKCVCEIARTKDSSRFAYLWLMLSPREAAPSLGALRVIIVISVQPVIHQHAPHKTHHYKGPRQEMRRGAGLQEQPSLITMANCHPPHPLVCRSIKQQRGRISLQTFKWICSGRTSCITCGTHDNYGRINTGGFMALLPPGDGCQIDTGPVFERRTRVQTPTRL